MQEGSFLPAAIPAALEEKAAAGIRRDRGHPHERHLLPEPEAEKGIRGPAGRGFQDRAVDAPLPFLLTGPRDRPDPAPLERHGTLAEGGIRCKDLFEVSVYRHVRVNPDPRFVPPPEDDSVQVSSLRPEPGVDPLVQGEPDHISRFISGHKGDDVHPGTAVAGEPEDITEGADEPGLFVGCRIAAHSAPPPATGTTSWWYFTSGASRSGCSRARASSVG